MRSGDLPTQISRLVTGPRHRTASTSGAAYPERVRGDGDGWVVSDTGNPYWGRFGAAGLLLRAPLRDGTPAVLLQHRAPWSHQGGTWGLPGGARDSHETAAEASGTDWTYTTVVADAAELLQTEANYESAEMRWVGEDEVAALPLHPGFAASWQRLRTAPEALPLHHDDELRRSLPRTIEVEQGVFVWCTAGHPDQAPSQLSSRISSLLQVPN